MAFREEEDRLTLLKQAIKNKQPARCYIFYGQEAYLRSYWLGRLTKLLVDPTTEAFNFHRYNAENFSAQELADSLQSPPMMADYSFVLVEDVDLFKRNEEERTLLSTALAEIPEDCVLVLLYETVEYKPDKRMKALSDALSKAVAVEFRTPSERELATWIARHFKSCGKSASVETCRYLAQITGGDMTLLAAEIDKIAAYTQNEEVTRTEIDAVTEPVLEAVVFDLSDAVAAGRFDLALGKLETLLQMQEKPPAILGAIGSQLRRTLTAKTLLRAGKGKDELGALCGVRGYAAQKTMEFARRMPDRFCEQAVLLCLETDVQMKTSYDDPERLLELLIARLAQEARRA